MLTLVSGSTDRRREPSAVDFELSADQELLRTTVRRYLSMRAPLDGYVRARLGEPRAASDAVWRGLAELGVSGLLVPESFGGSGAGMVEVGAVAEEMGRALHPGPFVASAVGATSLILAAGSDADRARLLPDLARGRTVATVALDAPRSATAPAVAEATGDSWTLTGEGAHVPAATGADVLLVPARDPDGLVGAFAVDASEPGLTITPTPTVDGTWPEASVSLSTAPARRLGSHDASGAIAAARDRVGVALVLDGAGAAARVMELAVEHAEQRHQFGRPIGSFQAVQHLCADMLRAVELGRAAGYYAAWACDAADAAEAHRAATLALAYAADGFYSVGANAIQVFGGVGFTWEHDAHLFYKRLLTLQTWQGGRTAHLEELASLVLD